MTTSREIVALNAELDAHEQPSLDPRDFGFFACVQLRTRPAAKGERFLRAGFIPDSGRSFNYRDRSEEQGVSAYRIVNGAAVGASPFSPGAHGERAWFWITGEVVQIKLSEEHEWRDCGGSDGEALLYRARYVSRAHKIPAGIVG